MVEGLSESFRRLDRFYITRNRISNRSKVLAGEFVLGSALRGVYRGSLEYDSKGAKHNVNATFEMEPRQRDQQGPPVYCRSATA